MSDHARRSKRYAAMHQLLVQCDTWSEFAQLYASDVSLGGMFIVTDEAPEILSEVSIELKLPEGHEIALTGSVVHVVDAEQAARENRSPGIGVQFIALDALRKRQIQQLVEFARWEGASNNPTATYASRLFEMSASLPPSKVLDELPPAKDDDFGAPIARAQPSASAQPDAPAHTDLSSRPSRRTGGGNVSRRPRRADSGSVGAATEAVEASRRTGEQPTAEAAEATATPPKPTDPAKVKLGVTLLARKNFAQAISTFEAILKDNPGDLLMQQWVHIANARLHLANKDEASALEHYQKALAVDESNHEARKFVREHSTRKRLNSLPFGRYFVKKS